MLKNYLKVAWRNLKSDGTFSVINILGLSMGLAISILLFMFIVREKSFDQMYAKKENIYRVLLHREGNHGEETWASVPAALAPAVKQSIPEVEKTARLLKHDFGGSAFIQANEQDFVETGLYWSDPEILNIFEVDYVYGNPVSPIDRPNTTLLSKSAATKYFGNRNPVGETIIVDNDKTLEVTGVFEDLPENSTFDANVIASFSTTNFSKNPSWGNASFETYFLLSPSTIPSDTEQKIQHILDKEMAPEDQWYSFTLQPLAKIHLYSAGITDSYSSRNGSITEIRNLSLLALLIMLTACINYMNLTTARSQKRTKDVGINKTLGASRKALILRFYIETGFITFVAILLGTILSILVIPVFNNITGQNLNFNIIFSFQFFMAFIAIWILTTLVAGSYPALYLSRFTPRKAMYSSSSKGSIASVIRQGLVVTQFSVSIILIISVLVIHNQMEFIRNKNLGYNPENVIAISTMAAHSGGNKNTIMNNFKVLPEVSEVSMAQGFPGVDVSGRSLYKDNATNGSTNIKTNKAEASTTEVLKLQMLAGQTLPAVKAEGDSLTDVVLNRQAVEFLGFTPEEAIGEKVNMQLGNNAYIRGVVEDFNFSSLHEPIGAYAFHNYNSEYEKFLLLRFNSSDIPATLEKFEKVFKETVPDSAFEYTFLDKNLEKLYASEQQTARIAMLFSILAIFVACLGLFGLAAFTAEQRTKEIGIRKVLGASVVGITRLLSADFIKLVFIALLIAFPLAYWISERWLEEFAYRIQVNWQTFIVAGVLALSITFATVSFQAIRAAIANPVKSLRTE